MKKYCAYVLLGLAVISNAALAKEAPLVSIPTHDAFFNAIKVDDQFSYPWYGLGYLYEYDLKQFNEAEVLHKAMELFWEKGFHATSHKCPSRSAK